MVQLSSCIIVAKKSIVLYDWASKELCSSCSLLESSLLRALQSERLDRCRTRRSDISVLGANAEFVKNEMNLQQHHNLPVGLLLFISFVLDLFVHILSTVEILRANPTLNHLSRKCCAEKLI